LPATPRNIWKVSQASKTGPAWSMGKRRKDPKTTKDDLPGPNIYGMPSKLSNRSFVIGTRFKDKDHNDAIPGPAKYDITESYQTVKPQTPRYSMGSKRTKQKSVLHTAPGPAKYLPPAGTKHKKAPKYTFSTRNKKTSSSGATPGPAAYSLPSTRAKPTITLKGRWKKLKTDSDHTPAPNQYNPARSARPTSARSVTISARKYLPDKSGESPGPGLYNPLRNMGYQTQEF